MPYQKYCFIKLKDTTFNDIVNAIEQAGIGAIIVVNQNYELIGLASDGDIRKCILNSTLSIESLINTKPEVWPIEKSKKAAINHLKKIRRNILPVLKQGVVVDVISLNEISFDLIDNVVVLMAGGLGSRLMPLTEDTPKPLLLINGKPMLERIIDKFIEQGFRNFYISVNYKGDKIKEYFSDGSKWDINIQYIDEDKRLGTAGALSKITDKLNKPFLVMNGDIVTDLNFRELLDYSNEQKGIATMCVYKQSQQIPFGVVEFDSDFTIKALVEKPQNDYFINMGIYVLHQNSCQYIPRDEFFDMPTLFHKIMQDSKNCNVYTFDGLWNDIGRIEDYKSINALGVKHE